MSQLISASAYKDITPTLARGQPPKNGHGFLRFVLDSIEQLPKAQEFIKEINHKRRNTRPGYSPTAMLRLFCLKYLLNERYNVQLLERLRASPVLLKLCGLESSPSESTCSRFFLKLTVHRALLEQAIADMVDRLHDELPDMGSTVSIDSTDVEAHGNPRHNPPIDEDATWGYRTSKSKSSTSSNKEYFYGYKVHMLGDAIYDVPLGYMLLPANKGDSPLLPSVVSKVARTHDWFAPKHLTADRGYDSNMNHKFLYDRSIIPVIHMRQPANAKLYDGVYTAEGTPTCLGGKEMTYVRTDPATGHHMYQCDASGCQRFKGGKGGNIFTRCDDAHWEDPTTNLRVIGIIPRQSREWKDLYRKRTGIERTFGSLKQSRLLNKHQCLTMAKVEAHVALSVLAYVATMYGKVMAGQIDQMRHMRVRV